MMMENGNSGDVRKRLESEKSEERNNGTCNADANTTSTNTGNGTTNKRDDDPGSDLLHWKDMPQHLQFNPYIFTGYRPMLSFWGCINSLFYMHNETINIITHAVPIVYILVTVPGLMPWGEPEFRFLSWCHLLGSVSPWVGSFLYHLFMNLERGEGVYYRLLQLDMLGIWISQSFGAMPMVTSTVYCLPALIRWTCILSYCLLSLWGLYKNSYDLIIERLKILEVNEDYIQMNMSLNKFSRTQAGITLYFTLLQDLSDKTYISFELFGEYSNEYRKLPVRIGRPICQILNLEFLWVKDAMLKDGVFPTKCPVKKNSYDLILERLKILEVNEDYIQMNMSMNKFNRTHAAITLYFTLLQDLSDKTYAMTAWSPWERRLCFLLPFSMRMLLCGLRVSSLGGGAPEALTHVFLQDAVSVIGAAIGAMHIPEKWFPGTVDMYLNSHNIMHVLVVAAVYSMHHATVKDFNWMVTVQCRATVAQTLHSTVTTVNAGL